MQVKDAVISRHRRPRVNGAGNRNRMWREAINLTNIIFKIPIHGGGRWSSPRAVISDDVALAFGCIQHETITAHAGHRGIDDTLNGAGCDSRVHGVATLLENAQRGHRR